MGRIENDPELQHVLWACYKYWAGESLPPDERLICYTWVKEVYEKEFGAQFQKSKLQHLAKLEFLSLGDTARGGRRRYYKLVDPDRIHEMLKSWETTRQHL